MTSGKPLGWFVKVTIAAGGTMEYVAGFFIPEEAEEAVADARHHPAGEKYKARDPITASHGPKIEPGEVREWTRLRL